jgi:hypothetical protein
MAESEFRQLMSTMLYSTPEEQWRECLGELWGVADEPSLPPEGKQLIERVHEETYALLQQRAAPLSAADVLASLPTSSEELTTLCATSRFEAAKDILARLLRADRRFRRYDAETFGLTEWDDAKHFIYYWSALERAWQAGDAKALEEAAAMIEKLQLLPEQRRRAKAVIGNYQRQVLRSPFAGAGAALAEKADRAATRAEC